MRAAIGPAELGADEILRRVLEHRSGARGGGERVSAALTAWAIIGMGTVTSMARDLGLFGARDRKRMWKQVGPVLLEGRRS